jgi:hypothetical protein
LQLVSQRFSALWFHFEFVGASLDQHRIKSGADSIFLSAIKGSLDRFFKFPRKKAGVKEMFFSKIFQPRQPLAVVEHALFEATGAILPIMTANSFFNRIKGGNPFRWEFSQRGACEEQATLALFLDVWTSEN